MEKPKKHIKRVIELDPNNADIWLEYSHLLREDDRLNEVRKKH